ncbi:MAG: hypothetical protein J3K34DRAFT_472289 [Monoraphidium minutum]|nr:MAG: hypothetical protein J3K34DRAFT_472289 [Monoraphidium minutum]
MAAAKRQGAWSALLALALLSLLPGAHAALPAETAVVEAAQCAWAAGFCDLSPAYMAARLSELAAAPPANASLALAMLKGAAQDTACAVLTRAATCAGNAACNWDPTAAPSCQPAHSAIAKALVPLTLCPGSAAEAEAQCAGATTIDACILAAALQAQRAAMNASYWGDCTQLEAGGAALEAACPAASPKAACAAPACALSASAGACVASRVTQLLVLAGLDDDAGAVMAARQCAAVPTRASCAAVGTPVTVDPVILAYIKDGNFTVTDLGTSATSDWLTAAVGGVSLLKRPTGGAGGRGAGAIVGAAALAALAVLL